MLILQFWQVLVNFHLFRLKGKWNCWLTWKWLKKKPRDFTYPRLFFPQAWCLFLIFWGWRKCFVRKLCCKGQHPPWCYPILFGLCCYYQVQRNIIISHFCEYDIARKQKPKENQKKKKKGKNIIDSGNVLGWTPTVSKGTDVETLHKLSYLCISFNGFNVHVG